jgi:hypothetical protein
VQWVLEWWAIQDLFQAAGSLIWVRENGWDRAYAAPLERRNGEDRGWNIRHGRAEKEREGQTEKWPEGDTHRED